MLITNEEVVERVMRSGIEYQTIGDIGKLFDLAKHQIGKERQQKEKLMHDTLVSQGSASTLAEYFDQCHRANVLCFIFSYINDKLVVLRVKEIKPTKVFSWGRYGNSFPYVEFA